MKEEQKKINDSQARTWGNIYINTKDYPIKVILIIKKITGEPINSID